MRVKLGNRIRFCINATHNKDDCTILLTILSGFLDVYVVDMGDCETANNAFEELLVKGYYNFDGYSYSN